MGNASQTIYCTECGTELSDGVSFCSECGTKLETESEDGFEDAEQDELIKEADKIVNSAEGPIISEMLIQLDKPKKILSGMRSDERRMLYERPLISYIDSDEKLDYLLPSLHGFRITEPDGTERTPHHGKRYAFLLLTDKRLIYVAAQDGEDHVMEFDYSEIERVGLNDAFIKHDKIEFHTDDGYRYRFSLDSSVPGHNLSWRTATKYIKRKANADGLNSIGKYKKDIKRSWSQEGLDESFLLKNGPGMNSNKPISSARNQTMLVIYLLTFPISIPYILYKKKTEKKSGGV